MCPISISFGFNTDRYIIQQNRQAINKYLTNKVEGRVSVNSKELIKMFNAFNNIVRSKRVHKYLVFNI